MTDEKQPQSSPPESTPDRETAPVSKEESNPELEQKVIEVLRTIYDPEIPVNIHELGLVYEIAVNDAGAASIVMTLTSPHCPVAESLPVEVKQKVEAAEGIQSCQVDITWEPPWGPDKMSEAARLTLGMV